MVKNEYTLTSNRFGVDPDTESYEIDVHKRKLTKSIYKKFGMIFILPAVIGTLHVIFSLKILSTTIANPYVGIWTPISVFFVIYAISYFIAIQLYNYTTIQSDRITKRKVNLLNNNNNTKNNYFIY